MVANDIQVGGKHYRSEYQHWDWVTNIGMGYLAGQVTKYLYRWRNKNGVQDLEKAGHFLDKLIEVSPIIVFEQRQSHFHRVWIEAETRAFFEANDISGPERVICVILANWASKTELHDARNVLSELVTEAKLTARTEPPKDRAVAKG